MVQIYDDIRKGWCFVSWWLEVREMALQQAGGPGPAAVEAAVQLVNTMPHSVPLHRCFTTCPYVAQGMPYMLQHVNEQAKHPPLYCRCRDMGHE